MANTLRVLLLLFFATGFGQAWADPAPFDLIGPKLSIKVSRAGVVLPIVDTPNLSPGDQLWIKADLPAAQSVRYLLVAVFLRGATNPPPQNWFYRSQTWSRKGRDGLMITVPRDAQQVLVFLAPHTGGDFKSLVDAVQARPGAFVRASQDLNQASLDRGRIDLFLAAIRKINQADPKKLKTASVLLARSLGIKLNDDCLQKSPDLQAACLMQGHDALVLNDSDTASLVGALTSGDTANLIQELSLTPQAGLGYYSAYIGAMMDFVRILDSLHTAHYQYIPALAIPERDELSLVLNAPPSFQNPMSVLVAALPAVEPSHPPLLHPVDPKAAYCAQKPDLVLPVEGAPLVFSTSYAHDIVLRLTTGSGKAVDLPVRADAEGGGFVAQTAGHAPDAPTGFLHGQWGFAPFDGPRFRLQTARTTRWALDAEDQQSLIVGRDDIVHLKSSAAACVVSVSLRGPSGKPKAIDWKLAKPDELSITAPLKDAQPGPLTLLINQYGGGEADVVPLRAFAEAGHLGSFTLHAGDLSGVLEGARLDEVAGLTLHGVPFRSAGFTTTNGKDELSIATSDVQGAGKLQAGDVSTAKVALKDGRTVDLKVKIESPRPRVVLIHKSVRPGTSHTPSMIELTEAEEVPQGAILTFSMRAQTPTIFSGHEKVEVATIDGAFSTSLDAANGLVLEDAGVALAALDTAKAFGASAFGPLQFRIVDAGVASDWQPLATLVRLPGLDSLKCPSATDQPCELTGSDLFLIGSLANDHTFAHAFKIPEGFTDRTLAVPHPPAGRLYVKLRDDPSVINLLAFQPEFGAASVHAAPGAESGRAVISPNSSGGGKSSANALAPASTAADPLPMPSVSGSPPPVLATNGAAAISASSAAKPPAHASAP